MVLFEPMETMESDRLWECPGRDSEKEPPADGHCTAAERELDADGGILSDNADLR